jgi:hypothetical protein
MADWIRLPRSMFDWDWFDKPEMLSLFLYLLNNAKEKEVKHDGIVEHRGQFLTSLGKLSTIIGAGKQVVRTCLSKLIKMQLIEVNTERLYSIITICNYDEYFEAEVNKPKDELKNEDTKLVEAPKEDKPKKTKEEIATATEKRKEKFYQELVPYVATYGKDMIRKFYDYWSETNKSKTRMRCETEKTWDLNLRLQNWARRNKDFGAKQSGTALHNSENKDYNEGGW